MIFKRGSISDRIFKLLKKTSKPMMILEISQELDLPINTVSSKLSVMVRGGIVSKKKNDFHYTEYWYDAPPFDDDQIIAATEGGLRSAESIANQFKQPLDRVKRMLKSLVAQGKIRQRRISEQLYEKAD